MKRRVRGRRPWRHGGQVLMLVLGLAGATLASGDVADQAADAPLEQRFQSLAAQLRCVVCQNQSLADSPAELAMDLKQVLREQLQGGASDEAVLAFMVQRYGEAVRYRPPLKPGTGLLWFGPALILGAGLLLLGRQWRSAGAAAIPDEQGPLA